MRFELLSRRSPRLHIVGLGVLLGLGLGTASVSTAANFARIEVFDGNGTAAPDGKGDPIPCAVVQDASGGRHVVDDTGAAAFYQPGLMNRDHYLRVWLLTADTMTGKRAWEEIALSVPEGAPVGTNANRRSITEGETTVLEAASPVPGNAVACPSSTRATDLLDHGVPTEAEYFRLRVVDAEDGRGVPMAELRTPEHPRQVHMTDSNGLLAFYDPPRMDPDLLPTGASGTCLPVDLRSVGYGAADLAAATQDPAPPVPCGSGEIFVSEGGSATVELTREDVARRLHRLTGYGIYRESWLLGVPECDAPGATDPCIPIDDPLLNADMVGGDGPRTALYDGKVWWTLGDTFPPTYTAGGFTSGAFATSTPPAAGGPNPMETGIDLTWVDPDEVTSAVLGVLSPHLNLPSIFTADEGGQERLYVTTRGDNVIGSYDWNHWGVSRLRLGPGSGFCPDTACFDWVEESDVGGGAPRPPPPPPPPPVSPPSRFRTRRRASATCTGPTPTRSCAPRPRRPPWRTPSPTRPSPRSWREALAPPKTWTG